MTRDVGDSGDPSHPFICGNSFPTSLLSSSTSSGHSGQIMFPANNHVASVYVNQGL
jgi:hypothetical protein